ncbi:hypothetical protein CKAH01_15741 [Colletotrichum kahawae]|uniref:Uncharacterized protein n=1 Tax=Colletotrichum kahawae TaxID=34407 RepID=A0AAE0D7W0_COLKA|nr:hypothetical protein CKAH01_15741 [Colletotrichum kahawae]
MPSKLEEDVFIARKLEKLGVGARTFRQLVGLYNNAEGALALQVESADTLKDRLVAPSTGPRTSGSAEARSECSSTQLNRTLRKAAWRKETYKYPMELLNSVFKGHWHTDAPWSALLTSAA